MYSILHELFHYPKINKLKKYKKPVIQVFPEVKYLYKCLRLAITPGQNEFWDMIAIVIAFDLLYKDFDNTITSLLEMGDKIIDQIQSILKSKETKNLSKGVARATNDLVMTFRDKDIPKKANSDNECYNYHKFNHFR